MLIDREDPRNRDRYGRNIYGQSVLLARRLIEAGVRVASISWAPDANATWDTHANNFTSLKNTLLPQLDAAVSSLLDDLVSRGTLERTLVVVMGEFGRSPKVNVAAGRDHWNFGYSFSSPAAASGPGMCTVAVTRSGHAPTSTPLPRPRLLPRSIAAWVFQPTLSFTTSWRTL